MSDDSLNEQIQAAIGAHGAWKMRLRSAAISGNADFDVPQIRRDDVCEFGRWLRSLPPDTVGEERMAKVHELHGTFHQEAARVAAMILDGDKDNALDGLGEGSPFQVTSKALTRELTAWRMGF